MSREEEDLVRETYERVPYPSGAHHHTHPDHVAALAILNGLDPAPPECARVLELGCADGGNLIPMAAELEESRFTGIDLSPRQIESGRAMVAELGLANVELRAMSILDVDRDLGEFDYIICHGVFSWVTPDVQEKILEICRDNLAPHGMAYVSYNTYPGWRTREVVRDMVLFHTRHCSDADDRAARALDLVQFLADSASGGDTHASIMRTAREQFEENRERPSYLLHEYLERTNAPMYFHQFVERAAAHGLEYLTEAEPSATEVDNLAPAVAERLHGFTDDRIELEQYVDFAVNRTFRRSLLCHANVRIDREPSSAKLRRLFFASATKPVSDAPQVRGGGSEGFRTERGAAFSSSHPLAKAALVTLAAAWPRALSFDELASGVAARLDANANDDAALTDLLASLHASGVVEMHALAPNCTEIVSDFPRVSALARRQAGAGLLITNQHRRVLKLDDPFARFLVAHTDGTRSHADLVRLLDREVTAGRLDVQAEGQPTHRIPAVLQALVEHHLRKMAEYALLVG
ncbi:MAG TPA: class I SAM-dependent methyltransferase [Thermoanaerobaculia bacterium]|jgi:methyltransferase-like protein/cyclopropane fatty-acyl-phospholipid synthase-like methyltransferase|nr:class I SAM-dependent methyltransferase [Thermoanaerobaculia bacterium]